MKKIDKIDYRYIEKTLFSYPDLCKKMEQQREAIMEKFPSLYGECIRGSTTSDPTGNKAIKLLTDLSLISLCKKIQAIEDTLAILRPHERKVFELYYLKHKSAVEVSMAIPCSVETVYRIKRKIVWISGHKMEVLHLE